MTYWKARIMYRNHIRLVIWWTLVTAVSVALVIGLASVVRIISTASAQEMQIANVTKDREELLSVLNGKMVMVDDMHDGYAIVTSVKDELFEVTEMSERENYDDFCRERRNTPEDARLNAIGYAIWLASAELKGNEIERLKARNYKLEAESVTILEHCKTLEDELAAIKAHNTAPKFTAYRKIKD